MLYVESVVTCFFFKQKTAYEMRISDWSSDVCSSDLCERPYEDEGGDDEAQHGPRRIIACPARNQHACHKRSGSAADEVDRTEQAPHFRFVYSLGPHEDRKSTRLNSSH